ncbi:hypothetical protein HBI70_153650 [Parastagonospora nodorum]|nr:hypothetical protein HBI75_024840 [Parastagonospora nodorum]KAH5064570.1 hypothetical protein HBH96_052370 [Parastagonospora nodorum]KAH5098967.1 hypothetical protein HBH72_113710 [Parastagonospora nodorum]KAH5160846.1 hypothetical protein HBH69_038910 [Parastagonospora nodorum]KAH5262340.1 hypothetical protein HBI70_153650 [Parastagonospora nodorum]
MPSPRSEAYRNQVQTRIIDLVSGNRPRDPHLSTVSTQRLIIEGIVEEIRIYRLDKEEKARREKERRKREKERRKREKRRMAEHRHGSGERHRYEGRGRRHHRDRSGEHDRRRGSRDRSRDASSHKRRHGRNDRGISDPVTEGRPDPNPDLMMTGGAGPAGALPPTRKSPSRPHHAKPGRAVVSRSPTRRHGPDGKTPFGQLPKKVAGVGFVAHALNTYKHIKAEHDTGHRSRGMLERTVDGWRGKKPDPTVRGGYSSEKRRETEKLTKEDRKGEVHGRRAQEEGRRDDRRGRDEGRTDRGRRKDRDHPRRKDDQRSRRADVGSENGRRNGEREFDRPDRRNPRYVYDFSRAPDEDTSPRGFSPHRTALGEAQLPHSPLPGRHPRVAYDDLYSEPSPAPPVHLQAATPLDRTSLHYPSPTRAPPHTSHDGLYANPSPGPSVHIQKATPPSFHHDGAPVWAPTSESFMPRPHTPASLRKDRPVSPARPAPSLRHERSPSRERFESRLAAERSITLSLPYSSPLPERRRSLSRSPSPPYPESPSDRSISPIQMPPPPGDSAVPSPPPLPPMPKATPNHAALFEQIQGNAPKLRKVRSREKRDASTPESAGHVYEETGHSHAVEERERRQTWSSDDGFGDGEEESQRRRELKKNFGE